jgi:hypothetical protein
MTRIRPQRVCRVSQVFSILGRRRITGRHFLPHAFFGALGPRLRYCCSIRCADAANLRLSDTRARQHGRFLSRGGNLALARMLGPFLPACRRSQMQHQFHRAERAVRGHVNSNTRMVKILLTIYAQPNSGGQSFAIQMLRAL